MRLCTIKGFIQYPCIYTKIHTKILLNERKLYNLAGSSVRTNEYLQRIDKFSTSNRLYIIRKVYATNEREKKKSNENYQTVENKVSQVLSCDFQCFAQTYPLRLCTGNSRQNLLRVFP